MGEKKEPRTGSADAWPLSIFYDTGYALQHQPVIHESCFSRARARVRLDDATLGI